MAFARAQALLLQQEVILCSPISLGKCQKNWDRNIALWHCENEDCQLLREFQLVDPNALLSGTRSALRFSAQGFASGSNLRLSYRSGDFQQDFIVNIDGRIRLE